MRAFRVRQVNKRPELGSAQARLNGKEWVTADVVDRALTVNGAISEAIRCCQNSPVVPSAISPDRIH